MTGLATATAIKQKVVKLKHKYSPEEALPEDGWYRYLYQPRKQHANQRQRIADLNWSEESFKRYLIMQDLPER